MADPRPLSRTELAEFLPTQRAIRAFEKLFDLVPPELEELLLLAETSLLYNQSVRSELVQLRNRVVQLDQELQMAKRQPNLDQLIKRIEILETLEG